MGPTLCNVIGSQSGAIRHARPFTELTPTGVKSETNQTRPPSRGFFIGANMSNEFHGTLKFMRQRGFGFIISDDGPEHFVHKTDLVRSQINCDLLEDGETRLSYRLEQDSKNEKLKAVDLRILD
jgi:cold shock CspA family protein